MKNQFVHPNWVALIEHLRLPRDLAGDFGDCAGFLTELAAAPPAERGAALRALIAAALLDGRFTRGEREWVNRAFAAAGLPSPARAVEAACRDFVAGDGFEPRKMPV